MNLGQHEQALPLAEKALEMSAGTIAAGHPFLADIHDTLADVHAALDHKERAVEHSRQAVAIHRDRFHREHPARIAALRELHDRLRDAGRKDEASQVRAELAARPGRGPNNAATAVTATTGSDPASGAK
jgi:hypothetical protein